MIEEVSNSDIPTELFNYNQTDSLLTSAEKKIKHLAPRDQQKFWYEFEDLDVTTMDENINHEEKQSDRTIEKKIPSCTD